SDDDSTGPKGGRHEGPASTSPYPMSRLSAPHSLVDTAREIQKADALLGAVTGDKLRLIADQIRALQEQARGLLEEARRSAELHRAECRFQKRVGNIYHLYRNGERLYFSMLSPEDWGGRAPHAYDGSYRLEADMGWTPVDRVADRDAQDASARRLLAEGAPEGKKSDDEG
ncbi:MAG TPA: DUF2452 domain-containing protein, partial [Polyangiaceae bacterium]|nr:DUF2452 domain-containing protein [Polyangiaceae bacterium]